MGAVIPLRADAHIILGADEAVLAETGAVRARGAGLRIC